MENFKSTLASATKTFTDKIGDYNVGGSFAYNGDGKIVMCGVNAALAATDTAPVMGIGLPKSSASLNPLSNPKAYHVPDDMDAAQVIPILKATYNKIVAEVAADTGI